MVCKGICERHRVNKPSGSRRYAAGQRRCQVCQIFMEWPGPSCPCCGYRLRMKPRNMKFKGMLKANIANTNQDIAGI